MKSLRGKNIILTGAGSGIGREMSKLFAAEGANLAIIDINKNNLDATLGLVKGGGITARAYVCDISEQAKVAKTVAQIQKDFPRVDVLINNAGVVTGKKFLDLTIEEMQWTMNINYWGHVYFTKLILPAMIAQKGGSIINIASSGGLLGMANMSDYCASKFAEVGFSESLRRELEKDGHRNIVVTAVCPYIIDTGMFEGFRSFVLSPVVKAERAARTIVNAVKKEKVLVLIPYYSIKFMQFLKLTPPSFLDWALRLVGGSRAMDNFVGRKKGGR